MIQVNMRFMITAFEACSNAVLHYDNFQEIFQNKITEIFIRCKIKWISEKNVE